MPKAKKQIENNASIQVGNLCWLWFDGRPTLNKVYHVTRCYYCTTNEEPFVNSRGDLVKRGDLFTIPPGHPNATFCPAPDPTTPPAFNPKTGLPSDTPPKPTPLF